MPAPQQGEALRLRLVSPPTEAREPRPAAPGGVRLRRCIGLPLVTFYGLGNILGAGIYVLIGKIAGVAGMLAPVAFFIASLAAAFTAFTYAEFASRLPSSAGVTAYLHAGFGRRRLSVLAGYLILASVLVSAGTLVNGFVGYLRVFVDLPPGVLAVLTVGLLAAVAASGVGLSLRATAVFTLIEAAGLLWVVAAAGDSLAALPAHLPQFAPGPSPASWQGILVGAFLAFYAYTGFEDMVTLAEEVREPERNMPRAILLALLASTVLYAAVALVAVLTVAPEELAASEAPLALVYNRATGADPAPIALISLFAVVNGALVQIIMLSRQLYGMSRRRWMPAWLGYLHPRRRTPLAAIAVVALLVAVLALSFALVALAAATSFLLLVIFVLVNLALLRVKRDRPRPSGARVFPRWVPVGGLVLSLLLLVLQLFSIDAWHP